MDYVQYYTQCHKLNKLHYCLHHFPADRGPKCKCLMAGSVTD